ncbi:hypothetical protein D3C72_1153800 [compost metagenome]
MRRASEKKASRRNGSSWVTLSGAPAASIWRSSGAEKIEAAISTTRAGMPTQIRA